MYNYQDFFFFRDLPDMTPEQLVHYMDDLEFLYSLEDDAILENFTNADQFEVDDSRICRSIRSGYNVILNDDFEIACKEAKQIITNFIKS